MKTSDFETLKSFLEDSLSKYAPDEAVKALSEKIQDLEQKYLEALPAALENGHGIPITSNTHWKTEKTAHDFIDFIGHVFKKDAEAIKAGQSEGIDTEGGFLVAPDFRSTLIRLIEEFGVVRRAATVIPMRSNTLDLPKLTSGVSAFWIDEGKPITESAAAFGNVTLTAKKLAALVPVTGELFEDSSIPMANLLATLFAEAFAEEEDRTALAGNRATGDPFDGVLHASGVGNYDMGGSTTSGATAFTDMTAEDLLSLTDQVPTASLNGSVFILHRTILNVLRKIRADAVSASDSAGAFLFQEPTATAPGTIWGWPYVLTDRMPNINDTAVSTPFVAFGNWRHFYIGDRRSFTIATSQHVGFKSDQIFIRATQRLAQRFAIPAAFAKLTTAAS